MFQGKGSVIIIWITIGIAMNIGIMTLYLIKCPISKLIIVPYIGLFLIVAGMIIRFIAVQSLGRFFTIYVTIQENHKIIKEGVYKMIRHPSYLGSLISFLGFGISVNNWISLIIVTIPIVIAFIYRIKEEEKILLKQFGSDYSEYMRSTYRLIPYIY